MDDQCHLHFTLPFTQSLVFSGGSSAILERLPCGHVRKGPYPSDRTLDPNLDDFAREAQIYKILGPHPLVISMIDYSPTRGLILESMPHGDLRSHLMSSHPSPPITPSQRTQWCRQTARAVSLLHSHSIIHSDINTRNLLLDNDMNVRIIDFGGSSIGDQIGTAVESTRFFLPRKWTDAPTVRTDLFALGSTLYEIQTGLPPWADRASHDVEADFGNKVFPALDGVVAHAEVIRKCWMGEYGCVEEVVVDLERDVVLSDSGGPVIDGE